MGLWRDGIVLAVVALTISIFMVGAQSLEDNDCGVRLRRVPRATCVVSVRLVVEEREPKADRLPEG